MNIVELIGFLVALIALIISAARKALDERRRRLDPEGYAREQEEERKQYEQMLRELGIEPEPEPPPTPKKKPPPPKKRIIEHRDLHQPPKHAGHRTLSDEFVFQSSIENRRQKTSIEGRTVGTRYVERFGAGFGENLVSRELRGQEVATVQHGTPRIQKFAGRFPDKRSWIIASEVIGPPKGMQ